MAYDYDKIFFEINELVSENPKTPLYGLSQHSTVHPIEAILPQLHKFVTAVCAKHKSCISIDQIDDFCNDIIVLLLENDCQPLMSYDQRKSLFNAWLSAVVRNHIHKTLRKIALTESLDYAKESNHIHPFFMPIQADVTIHKERIKRIGFVLRNNPSRRERRFLYLPTGNACGQDPDVGDKTSHVSGLCCLHDIAAMS